MIAVAAIVQRGDISTTVAADKGIVGALGGKASHMTSIKHASGVAVVFANE
jgi:hypothetical protein